ncbi:MAG: hypothetical protein U0R80_10060 [Nocardioidaceae bacterium]
MFMPAPAPPDRTPADVVEPPVRPSIGLSLAQVAGSALAAVSGAVLASWMGVTGTLVGAAVGSVAGTVGSATYTYSLRAGQDVVLRSATLPRRRTVQLREPSGEPVPEDRREERPDRPAWWRALPWPRLALASVAVLAVALVGLTAFEGLSGRPVSSLTGGSDGGGTTLSRAVGAGSGSTEDASTPGEPGQSPTTEPSTDPSESPTTDPTTGPTDEPSPSESPAPTEQPTPSPSSDGSPSSDPSGSAAPLAPSGGA